MRVKVELCNFIVCSSFFVLMFLFPYPVTGQMNPMEQERRDKFVERKKEWKEYISNLPAPRSSGYEVYVNCKEFHALLDLGPSIIPLIFESTDMGAFGGDAIQVLTRAYITDLMGLTSSEAAMMNIYPIEAAWWKERAIPEAGPETEKRLAAFHSKIPSASIINPSSLEASLKTPEGEKLTWLGVFGIPTIIDKLKRGETNPLYYRLLAYWTNPYELIDGIPVPPQSVKVTPEQSDPKHWLDWWEENVWQYRWLTEPAK